MGVPPVIFRFRFGFSIIHTMGISIDLRSPTHEERDFIKQSERNTFRPLNEPVKTSSRAMGAMGRRRWSWIIAGWGFLGCPRSFGSLFYHLKAFCSANTTPLHLWITKTLGMTIEKQYERIDIYCNIYYWNTLKLRSLIRLETTENQLKWLCTMSQNRTCNLLVPFL